MDERRRAREARLLAEEFGLLHEELGGTRMSGRVSAWLLLCDPPVQSLTEIAEALGVSKAAVSVATRSLLQAGLVERVSLPGRRGDSYRAVAGQMDAVLHLDRIEALDKLVHRCLELAADKDQTASNVQLLHELSEFLDFLKTEIPGLLERWQATRAARPATSPPEPDERRGDA
ncbi:MAG: MarR family transcriptional regulator [Thermoleophilia bacterium]|nr:MarR family transcriptional regulator [Thermoleophilia bacterium]